jgi:hypothetical protein
VAAHEPAGAAARDIPRHADRGGGTGEPREAGLPRGGGYRTPRRPGTDAGDPGVRVDRDVRERGGAQQQRALERRHAGRAVAGALRRDAQAAGGREADGLLHVARAARLDDGDGALVDCEVEARARGVPVVVVGTDDAAVERAVEAVEVGRGDRGHAGSWRRMRRQRRLTVPAPGAPAGAVIPR